MKNTFVFLFFISLNCLGQSPIQCDRPDQTETSFTVPKGRFQLESGFSFKKDDDLKTYSLPSSLWKYGIAKSWELRMITEWNSDVVGGEKLAGIQPIQLGAKVNFCEEKKGRPKTSLIAHLAIPDWASPDYKGNYYAPNFRFTLQNTLMDGLNLGYNVGANWSPFDGKPSGLYTLTLGYSLTQDLGFYGEIFGFFPQNDKPNHSIDGGFTYLISNDFMLDLSAGKRIAGETADFYLAFGISFRI